MNASVKALTLMIGKRHGLQDMNFEWWKDERPEVGAWDDLEGEEADGNAAASDEKSRGLNKFPCFSVLKDGAK